MYLQPICRPTHDRLVLRDEAESLINSHLPAGATGAPLLSRVGKTSEPSALHRLYRYDTVVLATFVPLASVHSHIDIDID